MIGSDDVLQSSKSTQENKIHDSKTSGRIKRTFQKLGIWKKYPPEKEELTQLQEETKIKSIDKDSIEREKQEDSTYHIDLK